MFRILAYLDPGTGSAIAQMVGGGVAALAITSKLYGRRILKALHPTKDAPEAEDGRGPE